MSIFKEKDFAERRTAAAEARKALLEKFKSRPSADDPMVIAKQQERQAIIEAREKRAREKEQVRQARLAQEAKERAERDARELAERLAREEAERIAAAEREIGEREQLAAELALDAERKAKRDARYAARKARSGKRW